MRVLHYIDCNTLSWLVPYLEHIKLLENFGVESALLCRPGGYVERTAEDFKIKTLTFKPLIASVPIFSPGFKSVVKNFKPDIIHTRLSSAAMIAGFWSKNLNVPVISTFDKPAKAKYYKNSVHCIACSEWVKNYMVQNQNINPEKISVVYNPVDANKFKRDDLTRKNLRKKLNVSDDEILISGMGIYIYRKGFDVLIKAFAQVYKSHKNIKLALIGGDGEKGKREEYLKLAEDLGIKIILPDEFVKDVKPYLWASDVFVMPSRSEGFSIALLEALSSGLPVIVSDIGPFTEFIKHEYNGLISKVDDVNNFAENIEKILNMNNSERENLINNALEVVKNNFAPEISANKTIEIYKRFMKVSAKS